MTAASLVLDPSLIAWDGDDYFGRKHDYWTLAADVATLFDCVEQADISVLMCSSLAEALVDRFPVLAAGELRDFSAMVYQFLARFISAGGDLQGIAVHVNPDIHTRPVFDDALKAESCRNIIYALGCGAEFVVATHDLVWLWGATLEVGGGGAPVECHVIRGVAQYTNFRDQLRRFYEENRKHNARSGFGSKLPSVLIPADLQALLDAALPVSPNESCCAYSLKAGLYIFFRRHHKNFYHGYPVSEGELIRRGVDTAEIPRI